MMYLLGQNDPNAILPTAGWESLSDAFTKFVWVALFLAVAVVLGLILHALLRRVFQQIVKDTKIKVDDLILKYTAPPLRLFLIMIITLLELRLLEPVADLNRASVDILRQIVGDLLIVGVTWLLIAGVDIFEAALLRRYDVNVRDNLAARKVHTQLRVIKRIVVIVILFIGLACLLMTFEKVRQLGTSLLASAGIAGIIIGFAAQRSLGTFIAGLQIAITQPIRIDDVVIVEGEWGRIEEITLTYVVVRIWDLRRLIVPINYFIEKPFQNWTRVSADILGTIYIYTDPTVPVAAVREELQRIVKESDKWDGKACGLVVTNMTERAVELRGLISAADASAAWDLRCDVREKLIAFLQAKYPDALPRNRVEMRPITLNAESGLPDKR